MSFIERITDAIEKFFSGDTELALWASIGVFALVMLLLLLIWPGVRRFLLVVFLLAAIITTILVQSSDRLNDMLRGSGAL
jgi:hypothetical protein